MKNKTQLPEYRGQAHLHRALRDTILPHLFGDGREKQTITIKEPGAAAYAIRQGFRLVEGELYELDKKQVNLSNAPKGENSPLSEEERSALKTRLRIAQALVASVHESLVAPFSVDDLWLYDAADGLGSDAHNLNDLRQDGRLPR